MKVFYHATHLRLDCLSLSQDLSSVGKVRAARREQVVMMAKYPLLMG